MYKLYIANRNYSTWSLRGWLVTRLSGAPFEEVLVQLSGKGRNPATGEAIQIKASKKVAFRATKELKMAI